MTYNNAAYVKLLFPCCSLPSVTLSWNTMAKAFTHFFHQHIFPMTVPHTHSQQFLTSLLSDQMATLLYPAQHG